MRRSPPTDWLMTLVSRCRRFEWRFSLSLCENVTLGVGVEKHTRVNRHCGFCHIENSVFCFFITKKRMFFAHINYGRARRRTWFAVWYMDACSKEGTSEDKLSHFSSVLNFRKIIIIFSIFSYHKIFIDRLGQLIKKKMRWSIQSIIFF